jgi:hypothetical protein
LGVPVGRKLRGIVAEAHFLVVVCLFIALFLMGIRVYDRIHGDAVGFSQRGLRDGDTGESD